MARHDDEHDVGESKHHDGAEEVDFMFFMAEWLCDHYEKRNKHVELNHRRVYEQLKEFSKEVIDAMQRRLDKEFQTWDKFEAIEVIPPAQAYEIRE